MQDAPAQLARSPRLPDQRLRISKRRIIRPDLRMGRIVAPPSPRPSIGAVKKTCAFDALDMSVAQHNVVAPGVWAGRHLDKRIEALIAQPAKPVRLWRCVRGGEISLPRVRDCVHVTRLLHGALLRS